MSGYQEGSGSIEGWTQFEEAVKGIFSEWTALNLAIQNRWGGPNDDNADICEDILNYFYDHATVYSDQLEDILDDFFQNELNVLVEDGSIEEVSKILVSLYEECKVGDFRRAMVYCSSARKASAYNSITSSRDASLYSTSSMAAPQISQNRMSRAAAFMSSFKEETFTNGEGDDDEDECMDDDDDDAEECEGEDCDMDMDMDDEDETPAASSGKKGKKHKSKKSTALEVDEDGFIMVGKGGKAKRK